jgi:hypothetical protein
MVQACSSAAVQQFAVVRPMWKSQACSKAESGGICRGLANKGWQAGQKLANSDEPLGQGLFRLPTGFAVKKKTARRPL